MSKRLLFCFVCILMYFCVIIVIVAQVPVWIINGGNALYWLFEEFEKIKKEIFTPITPINKEATNE